MKHSENIILTEELDNVLKFSLIDYDIDITNEAIIEYLESMESILNISSKKQAILDVKFNGFILGICKNSKGILNNKTEIKYQLLGSFRKTSLELFSGYKILMFIQKLSQKEIKFIKNDKRKKASLTNIIGLEFKKENIIELLKKINLIMENDIYAMYMNTENSKIKRKN